MLSIEFARRLLEGNSLKINPPLSSLRLSRRHFLGTAGVAGAAILFAIFASKSEPSSNTQSGVSTPRGADQPTFPIAESAQKLMNDPQLQAWRDQLPEGYSVTIAPYDPFLREFQEDSNYQAQDAQNQARGVYTRVLSSNEAGLADESLWVQAGRHVYANALVLIKDETGRTQGVFLSISKLERPKDFKAEPGSKAETVDLDRPVFANMSNFESRRFVDRDTNSVLVASASQFASPDISWPRSTSK